ncbi:hypothetical protein AVEN_61086-1 [Araneus ventricosus]|uniref:Uncharacterized protein n=1 Tax=Araneus ventricosus TaxID=182803 RepID=A0A4Y2M6I3_ARAVE|nr:hypothetical protein AVEN_61086-1 [Araneus ventricosus]
MYAHSLMADILQLILQPGRASCWRVWLLRLRPQYQVMADVLHLILQPRRASYWRGWLLRLRPQYQVMADVLQLILQPGSSCYWRVWLLRLRPQYQVRADVLQLILQPGRASYWRSWLLGLRPHYPNCHGGRSSSDPRCFGRAGVIPFVVIVSARKRKNSSAPHLVSDHFSTTERRISSSTEQKNVYIM